MTHHDYYQHHARACEEIERWRTDPQAELSPDALNSIGLALSFAWRLHNAQFPAFAIPGVDFPPGKILFDCAAESGYWPPINNLGVIYGEGLGVARDPAKAFELFTRAAQSLDPTPLRHLANCYRDGLGCNRDPTSQAFIEELIAVPKVEKESER
jgi:TPR repeat protein